LLLPLAVGLRLAHDRTIVHRDIKPDNIFLATDTLGRVQPKLLDFGIAKVGPGNVDARLTQVGVVLGSPEYMSPEQALGVDDIDERTDVWSLAVVLYEMVTGTMPFKKPNYNALMQAIIHEPATAMTAFAEGDESLWQVVERGLAKERARRWATMAELGEALALWLYEHGIKEDICGNSIRAVWLDATHSGLKVETIPTVPPGRGTSSLGRQKYSASARTLERKRFRVPLFGLRQVGQRRPVLVATAFGALFGGVIAALLLRERPREVVTLPVSSPSSIAAGTPSNTEVRAASKSGGTRHGDNASETGATPVEELTKEDDEAGASSLSATKNRAAGTTTNSKKIVSKGTKRRHDFGF
jgi:serine/threonine-protein kinase